MQLDTPEEVASEVATDTSEPEELSSNDISEVTIVIEGLTVEAINNPEVCMNSPSAQFP